MKIDIKPTSSLLYSIGVYVWVAGGYRWLSGNRVLQFPKHSASETPERHYPGAAAALWPRRQSAICSRVQTRRQTGDRDPADGAGTYNAGQRQLRRSLFAFAPNSNIGISIAQRGLWEVKVRWS